MVHLNTDTWLVPGLWPNTKSPCVKLRAHSDAHTLPCTYQFGQAFLQPPAKVHMLKTWSQDLVPMGCGRTWERLKSLSTCPWRDYWNPMPFAFSLLLPICYAISNHVHFQIWRTGSRWVQRQQVKPTKDFNQTDLSSFVLIWFGVFFEKCLLF